MRQAEHRRSKVFPCTYTPLLRGVCTRAYLADITRGCSAPLQVCAEKAPSEGELTLKQAEERQEDRYGLYTCISRAVLIPALISRAVNIV